MQYHDQNFSVHKKNAVQKYRQAKKEKHVDNALISLLDQINSFHDYFTTSSCAGRIVVLQLPQIGNKKKAVFLGKWHRRITFDELTAAVSKYDVDQLWILGQPSIFHIGCRSIEAADTMVKIGVASGFKHSGIKSLQDQIIAEVCSTERVDMPIGEQGCVLVDKKMLQFLLQKVNRVIKRTKEKLGRFEQNLELVDNKINMVKDS
jgi:tRNA wybutosine-synthesizing protein 3